jgi:hypothetical protein
LLLTQEGASFTVKDVRSDPVALAEMQAKADVRVAPVTVTGDHAFYGPFDEQRHRNLAALRDARRS